MKIYRRHLNRVREHILADKPNGIHGYSLSAYNGNERISVTVQSSTHQYGLVLTFDEADWLAQSLTAILSDLRSGRVNTVYVTPPDPVKAVLR